MICSMKFDVRMCERMAKFVKRAIPASDAICTVRMIFVSGDSLNALIFLNASGVSSRWLQRNEYSARGDNAPCDEADL